MAPVGPQPRPHRVSTASSGDTGRHVTACFHAFAPTFRASINSVGGPDRPTTASFRARAAPLRASTDELVAGSRRGSGVPTGCADSFPTVVLGGSTLSADRVMDPLKTPLGASPLSPRAARRLSPAASLGVARPELAPVSQACPAPGGAASGPPTPLRPHDEAEGDSKQRH